MLRSRPCQLHRSVMGCMHAPFKLPIPFNRGLHAYYGQAPISHTHRSTGGTWHDPVSLLSDTLPVNRGLVHALITFNYQLLLRSIESYMHAPVKLLSATISDQHRAQCILLSCSYQLYAVQQRNACILRSSSY